MPRERIALVSDIHANEIALEAVLADADRLGVDAIACLGDVATLGPKPHEVLQRLRERCAWFILGNHDEYMFVDEVDGSHVADPGVRSAVTWCRAALSPDEVAFLRSFERSVDVDLGAARLSLFHGSPRSNEEDVLAETAEATLDALLGAVDATVMAGGHTHVPMVRRHRDRFVVNPGSVGLPFQRYVGGGPPRILAAAEYAIVEARGADVSATLRRVPLERAALAAAARAWSEPLGGYLVGQYTS